MAPIITGTIVHFRFHIRCISIHKLLYFNFFSVPFAQHFCLRVLTNLLLLLLLLQISQSLDVMDFFPASCCLLRHRPTHCCRRPDHRSPQTVSLLLQDNRRYTPAKRKSKIVKYATENELLNKLRNGQRSPDSILQICVIDTRHVLTSGGEEWYELVGLHS